MTVQRKQSVATLAGLCLLLPFFALSAEERPAPDQVINAFEKAGGLHKGQRRNHPKGTCAIGSFTGEKAIGAWTSSALFSGESVPVVARFSMDGPNPAIPDAAKAPRGLALEFELPRGEVSHTTMLNVPVFIVNKPQSLLELLQANAPDPSTGKPDPAKLNAFFAAHPETKGMLGWLDSHNPTASYGETGFNSIHAFKFIGKDKKEHWIKWRFEPKAGEASMTEAQLKAKPNDFLDSEITERARKGPIEWTMFLIIGQEGDPIDNPTIAWPADRQKIKAGTLILTKAGVDAKGKCDGINFDPNVLSSGIKPSPDPVLQYRSAAYAVSFGRRQSEK